MQTTAKLIFLNGPSHSGKTTIAKALQAKIEEPFLHFGVSTVVGMLPERMVGTQETAREGFYWHHKGKNAAENSFQIIAGQYGKRVVSGMGYACLTLLQKGLSLIIDDVCYGAEQLQFYVNLFKEFPSLYVGIHCPLDVLHEREKMSHATLSTAQQELSIVHSQIAYDFEIDSSLLTVDESATKILEAFQDKIEQS